MTNTTTTTAISHPEQAAPAEVRSGWDRSDPAEWALRPGPIARLITRLSRRR